MTGHAPEKDSCLSELIVMHAKGYDTLEVLAVTGETNIMELLAETLERALRSY